MASVAGIDHVHVGAADAVQVIFVTVDPERDDSARMKAYVAAFDASFVGATGTPDALAAMRRNYGVTQLFVVRPGDELRPVDGLPSDIDAAEVGISILPFAAELSLPGGGGLAAA